MKEKGYIKETLADGKKFMGVIKLPEFTKFRHIDIIETSSECYPFGVLYFTGSGGFNARMRHHALSKGYSLNEYDFTDKLTKKPIKKEIIEKKLEKTTFDTEQDIFKFLDMDYVEPSARISLIK